MDQLERSLKRKLEGIFNRMDDIEVVLDCLKTDDERQVVLDFIEEEGGSPVPREVLFVAINLEDERKAEEAKEAAE